MFLKGSNVPEACFQCFHVLSTLLLCVNDYMSTAYNGLNEGEDDWTELGYMLEATGCLESEPPNILYEFTAAFYMLPYLL